MKEFVVADASADFSIDTERAGDVRSRERLLDLAFGAARVAKTSERLREGRRPAEGLALVARDRLGQVIGTVRLWHVEAAGRPALLLGPLAVHPWWRSRGVGARLMRACLHRAEALGHRAILLVGDAPYYARFGFSTEPAARLDLPGPVERARFLALELRQGALAGAEGAVVASGALAPVAKPAKRRAPLTTPARRAS